MYDNNGRGSADDYSFGFSDMDGWLGGTGDGSGTSNNYSAGSDGSFIPENNLSDNMNSIPVPDLNEVSDDDIWNSGNTYNDDSDKQEYDPPAEPKEYSEAYKKALSKVSRHKEDRKSIWQYRFGESNNADFGIPEWPARYNIEKYKYGDIAVKRPKAFYGRSHLVAKIILAAWLAASIVLTVVFFLKREYWTIVWSMIQITAGVCIYFALRPLNRLKKFPIFLAADALLTGGVIALRLAEPRGFAAFSSNMETTFITLFFTIVGAIPVTFGSAVLFRYLSRCSVKIMGMCINCIRVSAKNNTSKLYCPIYEFFYNKRKYIVRPDSYSTAAPPKLGEMYKLRINPLSPTDYFDVKRDGRLYVIVIVSGAIVMAVSLIFFITTVVNAFLSV